MPKRHPSLIPLTHDHHHTLAQARRLRDARSAAEPVALRRAADDFVNFYLARIRRHFDEEEELFFAPLVDRDDARTLIVRALVEHLRLHRDVRVLRRQLSVGEVAPELLVEIAEALEKHVRFEEQELFPVIERLVPQDDLLDLANAGRRDR